MHSASGMIIHSRIGSWTNPPQISTSRAASRRAWTRYTARPLIQSRGPVEPGGRVGPIRRPDVSGIQRLGASRPAIVRAGSVCFGLAIAVTFAAIAWMLVPAVYEAVSYVQVRRQENLRVLQ